MVKRKKSMSKKTKTLINRISFYISLIIFIGIFIIVSAVITLYMNLQKEIPSITDMIMYSPPTATTIYDSNNKKVLEYFVEKRIPVKLKEIPIYTIQATIALEDQRFYKHWGINIFRIAISLIKDLKSRKKAAGGSTITQQLARNMFLTLDKNISRKIKEALISIKLEKNFSKDEILEMYFNQINYGNGAYGIEAAANVYFGKSARELNLAESALLAGIPNLPERYNPLKHLKRAKKRQKICLYNMLEQGYISKEQFYSALNEKIALKKKKKEIRYGKYFIEEVRKQVINRFGYEALYKGGLKIYTTIDMDMQKRAEEVMGRQLKKYEKRYHIKETKAKYDSLSKEEKAKVKTIPYLESGTIIIENETGYIKVLVGGRDFNDSEYNRVYQAKRQPGSIFKVFLFGAAIENGMSPGDIIMDTPIILDDGSDEKYKPHNYDNKFLGPISLRKALALSRNVTAIRLIKNIGPETVASFAHKIGVKSPLMPVYSLALGSSDVTLLEMTRAFSVFPNYGIFKNTSLIRYIEDAEGNIIYKAQTKSRRVMDDDDAFIMTNMLETVAKHGTGASMKWLGIKTTAGGKTGTTNDYSDAWFIGFTKKYTEGVWVGFDELKSIGEKATGAAVALPIWAYTIKPFIDNTDTIPFQPTDSIIKVKICKETGMLPSKYCKILSEEYYKIGREPKEICTKHRKNSFNEYDFENKDTKSNDF